MSALENQGDPLSSLAAEEPSYRYTYPPLLVGRIKGSGFKLVPVRLHCSRYCNCDTEGGPPRVQPQGLRGLSPASQNLAAVYAQGPKAHQHQQDAVSCCLVGHSESIPKANVHLEHAYRPVWALHTCTSSGINPMKTLRSFNLRQAS